MAHPTVDELISGITSVEATLRKRHRELHHEIRVIEGDIGRAIQRRDALYKQRDQALTALTAIGVRLDEEDC